MMDDHSFNILEPTPDDLEDLINSIVNVVRENPGRDLVYSLGMVNERTNDLASTYLDDATVRIRDAVLTRIREQSLGATKSSRIGKTKYYNHGDYDDENHGWVVEYFLRLSFPNSTEPGRYF